MEELEGVAVSEGVAIAKAFLIKPHKLDWEVIHQRKGEGVEKELKKFKNSVEKVANYYENLLTTLAKEATRENLEIVQSQALLTKDVFLSQKVEEFLKTTGSNATSALKKAAESITKEFAHIDDEYLRQRVQDIEAVVLRIILDLENQSPMELSQINQEVIIVADDLTPSDTIQLNKKFVKGFVTQVGGKTSHSAIVARSLGIPAVLSVENALKKIQNSQYLALDGTTGKVWIEPSQEIINKYEKLKKEIDLHQQQLKEFINRPSITQDSRMFELAVNVGSVEEAIDASELNYDAIGLVRSEFLYMNALNWPTEEQQFEAYKEILLSAKGKKVVIRTLDIGGDKDLNYFKFDKETNPFLGHRAIRFCLQKKEIFKTQLRALARASKFGKLAVMFPMISTVEEFKEAKEMFLECYAEVLAKNCVEEDNFAKIEVGMMVETPAAALIADDLAEYSDFFSIGSNDLIQYTMAADRTNKKVNYLYQPLHPAILRMINLTIQGARQKGRWVGVCGEIGSDPYAFVLLVAMGINEISMSASSFLKNKALLSRINTKDLTQLLLEVSIKDNQKDIIRVIDQFFEKHL